MAKFHGVIGFVTSVESEPDIWEEQVVEREYIGNLDKRSFRQLSSDEIVHSLVLTNIISVIADDYIKNHYLDIRYIKINNRKLVVTSSEFDYPRINCTVGGEYNG